LPYLAVSAIVVDQDNPNTIYIGVSDHVWYGPSSIGVYKSTDGGLTWDDTALSFEFSDNIRIYWMTANPTDAQNILVTTSDGLYSTTDGFASTTKVNNLDCSEVHYKPNDSSTIYLGTRNGGFYKSTDAGANFNFITSFGSSFVRIAVTDSDDDLVYVSHSSTLYKSLDSGVTFPTTENLPQGNMVLSFSPLNARQLLVGNFEIHMSMNSGEDFTVITNWLGNGGLPLIHVDQRNIFTNPLQSNLIYFCNDGGLYTYNLGTDQFADLSDGLQITQYYDIATSQSNSEVVSGGSQDNGSMYRTTSGTWIELAATGDGMNTEIDPDDENLIYWEYQNGAMRRYNGSNNTGISPPGEDGNGAWETPYRLDPSNANRLIAGYGNVYESLNQVLISYSGYSSGQKVYRSVDAGDTWTNISENLPNVPVGALEIYEDVADAYFVGTDMGVFYKDNQSPEWFEYGQLPHTRVTDIEIQYSAQKLRIGTHGRGVFEADISIIECMVDSPDQDNDGVCDVYDNCPFLENALLGEPCDDGDPNSTGETYSTNCLCENGMSNIGTCAAAGSSGTGGDYITNIGLNDLNNSSGKSGYSDFRNINTALHDNNTYTLTMTLNFAFGPDEAYAWIDYDKDGVFENDEEIIMSAFDSNHTSSGQFTVPVLSDFGVTTMRVRNIYGSPGNNDPCNDYFGEVEDYTINLVDSCPYDRTVSQKVFDSPESITIKAENNIYLEYLIFNPNAQIKFDAGGVIYVNTDVDFKPGSNVKFQKGGCSD